VTPTTSSPSKVSWRAKICCRSRLSSASKTRGGNSEARLTSSGRGDGDPGGGDLAPACGGEGATSGAASRSRGPSGVCPAAPVRRSPQSEEPPSGPGAKLAECEHLVSKTTGVDPSPSWDLIAPSTGDIGWLPNLAHPSEKRTPRDRSQASKIMLPGRLSDQSCPEHEE
jgi:hypothetical protein